MKKAIGSFAAASIMAFCLWMSGEDFIKERSTVTGGAWFLVFFAAIMGYVMTGFITSLWRND